MDITSITAMAATFPGIGIGYPSVEMAPDIAEDEIVRMAEEGVEEAVR